jgi:hypothetical protein
MAWELVLLAFASERRFQSTRRRKHEFGLDDLRSNERKKKREEKSKLEAHNAMPQFKLQLQG